MASAAAPKQPGTSRFGWPSLYQLLVALQVLLLLLSLGLLHGVLERWRGQAVATIEVTGNLDQVDPAAVERQLAPYVDTEYLALPLAEIQAMLEQEPWIERVELRRRWPQSLEVRVFENRPIARWGQGGLVNERGRVFVPAALSGFEHLPELRGPDQRTLTMMRQYRDFSQLLRPLGLKLVALEMEARGAWTLDLDNGIRLRVGRGKALERMERFIRIYRAQLLDYADRIRQIDVRYTNGLTVTWNEPPQRVGSAKK